MDLYYKCIIVVISGREVYINISEMVGYVYDGQKITVMRNHIIRGLRERRFNAIKKPYVKSKIKMKDMSVDSMDSDIVEGDLVEEEIIDQDDSSVSTLAPDDVPGSLELGLLLNSST